MSSSLRTAQVCVAWSPQSRRTGVQRIAVALAVVAGLGVNLGYAGPGDGVIDVWYGPLQTFGYLGNTQNWVNVLGNVSDPDGVDTLTYSLNSGPDEDLSVGPDTRRLQKAGDFNVEIDRSNFNDGLNSLVITLTDSLGFQTQTTVTVDFSSTGVWPETYSIDWSTATAIEEVAQVVDGDWDIQAGGVRTMQMGYDRVVAVGDVTWDNYEAVVPFTVHAIDPNGFVWPSVAPGMGVILRWHGHTVWGSWQPNIGYLPSGGTIWYDWGNQGGRFKLFGNDGLTIYDNTGRKIINGVDYIFKIRAETQPGEGTLYSAKVWEASQAEPGTWDFSGMDGPADLTNGSMLLVAHHVDVTFGNLTVTPLPDPSPLSIYNVQATTGETWATVTWSTNVPADSSMDYGETPAYELGTVSDPNLTTLHSLTITNLTPDTPYLIEVTSVDIDVNIAVETDTFSTRAPDLSGIVSDDFFGATLDPNLWTFQDPRGDSSYAMTGSQIAISTPAGVDHSPWVDGNFAARIMQPANNVDMEVAAKFESPITERYQLQGILVEQDAGNYLRTEFLSDGQGTKLYAASFADNVPTTRKYISVSGAAPLYLRINRTDDDWTLSYSYNGVSWVVLNSFNVPLVVSSVGVYGGNTSDGVGIDPPAHTAVIDYFFNTASPVVPEDGGMLSVTTFVDGVGTVTRDPNQPAYNLNDNVTLTAVPDPQWTFETWTGDIVSTDNPLALTVTSDMVLTAVFSPNFNIDPPEITNVQVEAGDDYAIFTWETNEPADSTVAYGLTSGYELGAVSDPNFVTLHSVTLTPIDPWTIYHFQVSSADPSTNSTSAPGDTFSTSGPDFSGIVSDDFFAPALDPNTWTFIDPIGDASYGMTGTQITLTVPEGSDHSVWITGNRSARIMQPAADENFELEVKFESPVTLRYQQQGMIVEEDADSFLRLEFYSNGGTTYILAISFANGTPTTHVNSVIPGAQKSYMRVKRIGDTWIMSYSLDGLEWFGAGSFNAALLVSSVGVYAANESDSGQNQPAHTAIVDYFFNTASPVIPEDGYELTVGKTGQGAVTKTPDLPQYPQNDLVDLEAFPNAGWVFDSWVGDVVSTDNPLTVSMTQDLLITAVFIPEDVAPPVISNVQVTVGLDSAMITWTTDEPADSSVAYGLTAGYELGGVSDPTLVTAHSITLLNLDSDTLYHYQITSTDAADNSANTVDDTFQTDPPICFGDLDGDQDVDLADLARMLSHYGLTSGAAYDEGDLDGDGDIDLADVSALLTVYGQTCN